MRLYEELLNDCLSTGCTGMLLDCRALDGRLRTMGRYELGAFMADLHWERVAEGGVPPRIAIVAGAPLCDPRMFLETVAVNRGVELRTVTSPCEALSWLGVPAEELPEWAAERQKEQDTGAHDWPGATNAAGFTAPAVLPAIPSP
jgi:hypothetical protein